MCPLRVILIFLSATLAGFFLLKNINNKQQLHDDDLILERDSPDPISSPQKIPQSSSKVRGAIETGFWTCVDMASGRYLWRNLVSSTPSPKRPT